MLLTDSLPQQLLRSVRLVGLFLLLGHVEKSCTKSKVV